MDIPKMGKMGRGSVKIFEKNNLEHNALKS